MDADQVGFIGLGRMGTPIAINLLRAGTPLVVWTRKAARVHELEGHGACAAVSVADLWSRCRTVLFMLANKTAFEEVLGWDGIRFAVPMQGRTVVNLGTIAPDSSLTFHRLISDAGGRYVEAPVSGSRVPAGRGELVLMLAGEQLDDVEDLLGPIYATVVRCGDVPKATVTKLAVNALLVSLVPALAESVALAERSGIDLEVFRTVLDQGPMASAVSTIKLAKMLDNDLDPQAAVADVAYNCRLVLDMAEHLEATAPMTRQSLALYERAAALGYGTQDMAAVVEALRRPGAERLKA